MRKKMHDFSVLLAGVAALAATSSMACSLVRPDPMDLKKMMAKEIAYRLGIKIQQVRLDDITEPELYLPLGLEADCSGLAAFHHSSGFRIALEPPKFKVKRIDPTYKAGGAGKRARARIGGNYWWYGPNFRGRPRGSPIFTPGATPLPPDIQAQNNYLTGLQANGTSFSRYSREPAYSYSKNTNYTRGSSFAPAPAPMRWPQYPQESDFPIPGDMQQQPTWSFMQMPPLSSPAPSAAAQKEGCTYEGVAVILGFFQSSPVAVNFKRQCG